MQIDMTYLTSASTTNVRKFDFDSSSTLNFVSTVYNNWEIRFCYGPESFPF